MKLTYTKAKLQELCIQAINGADAYRAKTTADYLALYKTRKVDYDALSGWQRYSKREPFNLLGTAPNGSANTTYDFLNARSELMNTIGGFDWTRRTASEMLIALADCTDDNVVVDHKTITSLKVAAKCL